MTLFVVLTQISQTVMHALWRELVAWKLPKSRATFGAQAVLSVALSVVLANALGLSDTWWAAISGFAVMQTSFAGSVQRAAQRVMGTVIGAALATMAGPWIGDRPWLFVPALGMIGGVAVYQANGSKTAYAWILGGVTALMVTYEAHMLASIQATALFAALRVAEVTVGTLACLLVASVFNFFPKWYRKNTTPSEASSGSMASEAAETATADSMPPLAPATSTRLLVCLQAASSITILASLSYLLNLPGFAQAMVTTIAVLIVPQGLAVDRTRQPIMEKMVQRVAGCLLAGVVGAALIPLMQGQAILCMLALTIGVWVGCHVQTGREGASYVGRQFAIAFIMVFVQDHHWSADPLPALMRLSGIVSGVVVLGVVMLGTSRLYIPPITPDAHR